MTLKNQNEGARSPGDEHEARITAYAFGELEGGERAEMEAAVAADPALAARVAELRAFGEDLGATLADEAGAERQTGRAAAMTSAPQGRVLRFPVWAWAAAGCAAAASVAVMVSLREAAPPARGPEVARVKVEPESGPSMAGVGAPAEPAVSAATVPEVVFAVPPGADVFQAAPPITSGEVRDGQNPLAGLLAAGRSQYVAGDLDRAAESFRMVESIKPQQPEAGYFLSRIADEKAKLGALNREASRAKMLQEVATAWQRPASAASVTPPAEPSVIPVTYGGRPPAAPPAALMSRAIPHTFHVAEGDWTRASGPSVSFFEPAGGDEVYAGIRENGFLAAADEPLSTFSIDVDTASYSNVRRFLQSGRLPPRDAVRIEELINYFPYRYAGPAAATAESRGGAPFAANLAVVSAPWAPAHRLVRIGIKGRELTAETRPAANLVFLVDVSGSMSAENKLPLVKSSLRLLLGRLRGDDRVAIVTYAGASGLALPSTPAERGGEILDALDRLESGGSTNGGMGIHLAYDIAKANFVAEGINRVILCTDGDFNVGVTGREELLALIQEKARSRVFLTVLGFGMGNLKDGTLERLADKGNGAYGYIDSRREARKVFVEQVEGTLATIAKDVKIQVEFNPARVASYRLIGYENRVLAKEEFNDDRIDAGEVGAGHTVTALYEIVPVGARAGTGDGRPEVDELKYAPAKPRAAEAGPVVIGGMSDAEAGELLTVKIRYKEPLGDVSRKLEFPLVDRGADFAAADGEFQFAAAVAAWGMLLRESPHAGAASFERVLAWAEDGLGNDPEGHRAEFVELVRSARASRR